jgi:threonine/homoserine/homoserine lactone efflux protein
VVLSAFLLETVSISLSGVMAPGPLSATVVGKGSASPYAGVLIAFGHGIVEFPLMVALFFGAGPAFSIPVVRMVVALLGGGFLLFMGIGMLRNLRSGEPAARRDGRSPLLIGIMLSAGNPLFLIWWATVGVALILRAVEFGVLGFVAFAVAHWLCDLIWYIFLAAVSFKGGQVFGHNFRRAVFAVTGLFLLFMSGKFIVDGVRMFVA